MARPRPPKPAPDHSVRTYVKVARSDIALFRFLLEAHDNLGIFTVADRFQGILMLRYSPHQKREMEEFLEAAQEELTIEILPDTVILKD